MSIPVARLAATVTFPTNSAEILRVNRPAKPIYDNGPLFKARKCCDRPCFHENLRRQRQVATAHLLLLLFPFVGLFPRRPTNDFPKPA